MSDIISESAIVQSMGATKITYAAKVANKGNTKAVVIPVDIFTEMGLEVGEMIQITLEKLPRD